MTKLSVVKTVCYDEYKEDHKRVDYWLMHGNDFGEVAREVEKEFGNEIEEFTITPLEEGALWIPEVVANGIKHFFTDNFSYSVEEEDF